MTNEKILSIQELDEEGCEALNRAIHGKLHGLEVSVASNGTTLARIINPQPNQYNEWVVIKIPDYCHDIKACWQIKEWLDKQDDKVSTKAKYADILLNIPIDATYVRGDCDLAWASPLDRVRAFLLIDDEILQIYKLIALTM